jgi:transposase
VDAIRYLDRTGCQWDALPVDFPHYKLVYHYFKTWTADGTLNRMHNSLREQVRTTVEGRNRQPSAAVVDSQTVRGAETVGRSSRGYDAGKKINGRKRHIAVDTCGLLLAILVTAGNVQDRNAARPLLWALRACFPTIALVWADSGYAGRLVDWAATNLPKTLIYQALSKRPRVRRPRTPLWPRADCLIRPLSPRTATTRRLHRPAAGGQRSTHPARLPVHEEVELDDEFGGWLAEAYQVGQGAHLRRSATA